MSEPVRPADKAELLVGHYETHGELIQRWLESQA
jgi:hypothetical protein